MISWSKRSCLWSAIEYFRSYLSCHGRITVFRFGHPSWFGSQSKVLGRRRGDWRCWALRPWCRPAWRNPPSREVVTHCSACRWSARGRTRSSASSNPLSLCSGIIQASWRGAHIFIVFPCRSRTFSCIHLLCCVGRDRDHSWSKSKCPLSLPFCLELT